MDNIKNTFEEINLNGYKIHIFKNKVKIFNHENLTFDQFKSTSDRLVYYLMAEGFIDTKMKIKVFVHLNDLPGAFDVMSEQLTLASESGLLDAADEVVLCTNGKPESFNGAKEVLAEYENVTFVHTSDSAGNWEYPTLDLLHQECASVPEEECYICYFHLKGLSRPNDAKAVEWRQYLNYWTIERWEDNVKKLDEGMDTVGVDFIEAPWPHYSGNFWWARASYIRKIGRAHV